VWAALQVYSNGSVVQQRASAEVLYSQFEHNGTPSEAQRWVDSGNDEKWSGEPPRTRTWNPLIKSQLLYQLS
jgi:hypothetical protein